MKYVASINTPGYLPEGDTPVFDTPGEAWAWLADERKRGEEDAGDLGDTFSETVDRLSEQDSVGVVYAATPGYSGRHDLGLAYCVTTATDEEAAEIEALQY
jgi:hypothetical protein